MPQIFPFRALRATADKVTKFSASAYDSDSRGEFFRLAGQNEVSYLRILNSRAFADTPISFDESYALSRNRIKSLIDSGILVKESLPSVYIYRQNRKNNTFTSIIALVAINDYKSGKIRKHELTRTEKQKYITEYFNNVGINGSPVLLTYRHNEKLALLLQELVEPAPEYHFVAEDGSEHFLWIVNDETQCDRIQDILNNKNAFYIADGHHRCAAAAETGFSHFMACLIDEEQLKIHAFHRYVKNLGNISAEDFLAQLHSTFKVEKCNTPQPSPGPGKFCLYISGAWYNIFVPDELKKISNHKERLDVYILDNHIFNNILGITDSRTSKQIAFANGEIEYDDLIAPIVRNEFAAVFALHPVSMKDVMDISDINETMPPKSTWIEPKMRSGLLIHQLKDSTDTF